MAAQKEGNQNTVQVTRGSLWGGSNLVCGTLSFGVRSLPWRWRQQVAPKRRHVPRNYVGSHLRMFASACHEDAPSTTTPMCQLQPLLQHQPYTNFICNLYTLFAVLFYCLPLPSIPFPPSLLLLLLRLSGYFQPDRLSAPLPKNANKLNWGIAGNMATDSVLCSVRNSSGAHPKCTGSSFPG